MTAKKSPWLTLFLIVVIFVGVLVNVMQWSDLKSERELLKQEEQSLALARTRLTAMVELDKQKGQMEADLVVLGRLLPEAPSEDKLMVDLQSGADLASMEFVQVRFGERVSGEGYMEMPLTMLFNGTYHELLHFLDYLQVYERAVRIDELRVDAGTADSTDMTVSIKASSFYAAQ